MTGEECVRSTVKPTGGGSVRSRRHSSFTHNVNGVQGRGEGGGSGKKEWVEHGGTSRKRKGQPVHWLLQQWRRPTDISLQPEMKASRFVSYGVFINLLFLLQATGKLNTYTYIHKAIETLHRRTPLSVPSTLQNCVLQQVI